MPIINKATPIDPRQIDDPIARITSVQKIDSGGIKLSLYGRAKTGKTRLISSFPKPVLIIGSEDGTRSIRNVERVDFVQVFRSSEVGKLLEHAKRKGYQTVAIDTATSLQAIILAEILGIEELPTQKHWGLATRDQYGQCALQTKTILHEVMKLRCNVVITAHERNFSDDVEVSPELLTPNIGSALSPSVANWLNGECEYVAQTFIRSLVTREEIEPGIVNETVTNKGEYCLRVGPHPVYNTGFRVPVGVLLPDVITNPTYDKINALVSGKTTPTPIPIVVQKGTT